MAKLGAHGKELARVEKEDATEREATDWHRTTFALMEDGTVLRKYDARFKATAYSPARKHSYGWTVAAKRAKDAKRPLVELVDGWVAAYEKVGFKRVA